MNLWVDRLQPPPDGWVWAQSSSGAIDALSLGEIERLSLDYELGGNDTTYLVVCWMRENRMWLREICVHCANPVCAKWLAGMIDRYRE